MIFIMRKTSCRNISLAVDFMLVHERGREQSWRVLILMEMSLSSATFFPTKMASCSASEQSSTSQCSWTLARTVSQSLRILFYTALKQRHCFQLGLVPSVPFGTKRLGSQKTWETELYLGATTLDQNVRHITRSESVFSFIPSGLLMLGAG